MAKKESDPVRIQLTLGILGFLGVLLGVLATIFAPIIQDNLRQRNQPTQTPIIIVATPTVSTPVPTDTVPPGEPTSTPAPTDTPTPEPTFTPLPLEAGQDWLQNCISTVWKVYPASTSTSTNGTCYVEALAGVFSITDQHLNLFFDDKVTGEQTVGIFVKVPSNSIVDVNVHLEQIDVGELWVGIFARDDINSDGLLIAAPQGNPNNSAFAIRTMPDNDGPLTSKFKKDNGNYLFSFDVVPSKVGVTIEKYTTFNPVPVSSEEKWLFLGYRALFGNTNHIEGDFFDLKITPR